jgi:hypothetical protein
MVPPEGTCALAPKEPYVDHLTGDVYSPQPMSKPPWQSGKAKDMTLSYYKTAGLSIVPP